MENLPIAALSLPSGKGFLVFPLLLACWMAWGDIRSHRIPNYLTLFTALSGLGFQVGAFGWAGLVQGLLGLMLGFGLMLPFYLKGGMGAGDVKALAALGAWLGPRPTLFLFIYMGLAGLPLLLFYLWRRGELRAAAARCWSAILGFFLSRPHSLSLAPSSAATPSTGIPYATAIALGMMVLVWRGM